MKTKTPIIDFLTKKAAIASACLYAISLSSASSQSVDVFQLLDVKTGSAEPGNSNQTPQDIEVLKSKPSRFAVGNVDLYTAARLADLSMKSRATDPFGMYQDPNYKPPVKTFAAPKEGPKGELPAVPLSEIVQLIKVSTVMVKEKGFLVKEGGVYKESEEFEITFEGRNRRLKVLQVESEYIRFKDLQSEEEATLKLEILPAGMQSGNDKIRPAGMVSPTESKTLTLER